MADLTECSNCHLPAPVEWICAGEGQCGCPCHKKGSVSVPVEELKLERESHDAEIRRIWSALRLHGIPTIEAIVREINRLMEWSGKE